MSTKKTIQVLIERSDGNNRLTTAADDLNELTQVWCERCEALCQYVQMFICTSRTHSTHPHTRTTQALYYKCNVTPDTARFEYFDNVFSEYVDISDLEWESVTQDAKLRVKLHLKQQGR